MPDGWDYDPVRDTYRPSSRSKSSQSQNENNSLVPEGGEEDGEAGTGYEGGNAVTNAKDEDAATDEDRESSGSEETRRASNRSSPAREGKDASGDTAKDKAGDDSATEDDTEDDATDDDEDEDDDEDSDGHTVLKDDYDFDIREHGIAHLSNPDFPFAKAMEAYIVIGIDPYGNIKRPREQYWAWRNMYRLLNTA